MITSLPTRECGLKLFDSKKEANRYMVTPYAGVWIEIAYSLVPDRWLWSLPTRECGLKLLLILMYGIRPLSLPTRECGLKFFSGDPWRDQKGSLPTRPNYIAECLHTSPHHSLTYHIPYMLFGFCGGESFVLVPFCYMLECLLQKFCMRFIVAIVFGTLFLTILGHEEVVNFPKVCFMRV